MMKKRCFRLFACLFLVACSERQGSGPDAATGSGGVMVDAGAIGTGGASASTGGSSGSGGTASSGGTTGAGGALATGGASSGGMSSGGTSSSGGSVATGGSAATGGDSAMGGSAAIGGRGGVTSSAGGRAGATATGGKPGSGGTKGAGGASTNATGPVETKPTGYGQATTGGGNAPAMTVASMAALQAAIDAYAGSGGLVLTYTGRFDFSSIADPCTQWKLPAQVVEIKKKNDITILGADGSGANFGLHIASSSSNIIVRNMTFGLLPGGDASDALSVEGMSSGFPTDIWIDHNELFSSMAECDGAGDSSFDGLLDLKKGADRVTVSYNYFHDHHKVSLNGFSDSDDAVRHITFHHNLFENVGSRTPLQRHGYSHIYDNAFSKIATSGINVRMGGYALVEANDFESAENPVTSRDSDAIGYWELRDNNVKAPADFATYGITWVASTSSPSKDASDWTTTAMFPVALGYAYKSDPAACLAGRLKAVAGAGKHLSTLACP